MLSLAKTYELKELQTWSAGRPLVGMYKIDGNSLSLIYEKGSLSLAKTRGNGEFGEDVTAKVRNVSECCPQLADKNVPARLEVRGELYAPSEIFPACSGICRPRAWKPEQPQKYCSGILGRKQHTDLAGISASSPLTFLLMVRIPASERTGKAGLAGRAGGSPCRHTGHFPGYRTSKSFSMRPKASWMMVFTA